MIIQILLSFILLILLYFISKRISSALYTIFLLISQNKHFTNILLALIFLPGTILHEMSHFLAATILRVPTGNLSVLPEEEKEGEIKAGKLELGKADPFRYSLIGLAPILTGLTVIFILGKNSGLELNSLFNFKITVMQLAVFFVSIVISVTMFSSRKDAESLIISGPIILLITLSLYLIGVRVILNQNLTEAIGAFFTSINKYLLFILILDWLLLIILHLMVNLLGKILGRKFIER